MAELEVGGAHLGGGGAVKTNRRFKCRSVARFGFVFFYTVTCRSRARAARAPRERTRSLALPFAARCISLARSARAPRGICFGAVNRAGRFEPLPARARARAGNWP